MTDKPQSNKNLDVYTSEQLEAMYIEAVNAGRDDISYEQFVAETMANHQSKQKDIKNGKKTQNTKGVDGKGKDKKSSSHKNKSKPAQDDGQVVSKKRSERVDDNKQADGGDVGNNGHNRDEGSQAQDEKVTDSVDDENTVLDEKEQRVVDDAVDSYAQDGGLTRKQERFCVEFIKDYNATQAATRAGYSSRSAGQIGHDLLKKHEIVDYINTLERPVIKRAKVTAEMLQQEYEAIAMANLDDFVRLDSRGQPVIDLSHAIGNRALMAGLSQLEVREAGTQELVIGGNEIEREVFNTKIKIGDKLKAMEFLAKRLGIAKEDTGPTINNNITMDAHEIAQRLSLILRKQAADAEANKIAKDKARSKQETD